MSAQFLVSIHPTAKAAGARLPDRKHPDDAGFDLYPVNLPGWPQFPYTLKPGEVVKIPTGITVVAPRGWHPEVVAKTSRALEGIVPAAVVYDWGYRPNPDAPEGSVCTVRNVSSQDVVVGLKAFAQLVLRPDCDCEVVEVPHGTIDCNTQRGAKRYGVADGEPDPIAKSFSPEAEPTGTPGEPSALDPSVVRGVIDG